MGRKFLKNLQFAHDGQVKSIFICFEFSNFVRTERSTHRIKIELSIFLDFKYNFHQYLTIKLAAAYLTNTCLVRILIFISAILDYIVVRSRLDVEN